MNFCIIFEHAPHGSAHGREGLDFLLAMASFYEDIGIVFTGDGVYQLLKDQMPVSVLSRNHSKTFRLMDLYGLDKIFVAEKDLAERGLAASDLIVNARVVSSEMIRNIISESSRKVVF